MADAIDEKVQNLMSSEEYDGLSKLIGLGEKVTPKLVEILSKDSDSLMRKRAAIALGGIRDKSAAKPLVGALTDKDPTVVISVIDALAMLGEKDLSQNITPLLWNTDPSVRRHAAKALGTLGDKESAPHLEEVSAKDGYDFVRKEASQALRKIENP